MQASDARRWRRYLAVFSSLSAAAIISVVALNYIVDPYLIHQWDTPQIQRLRPPRDRLSPWGKTYALARFRPAIVYLGNSRTEIGLPADVPEFAGKTVFNGALSGASVADAIAMERHAARVSQLDIVVWGIDAPSFSMENGNTDLDPDLIADGRFYFLRRGLLNIKRDLSVDMTRSSIDQLTGKAEAQCRSSLAFHGQRDNACIELRIGGWGGTKAAVTPRTSEFVRGAGPLDQAMHALESSVDDLCQRGARTRLYINPTHAMMLDALYWAGKWTPVERWERTLAELAARKRSAGCDVRVVDFSGFNSITTEPIPQVTKQTNMANYWETSHYRGNVGRLILARLFGGDSIAVPDDFGTELLPATMDAHLAALRAGREAYHLQHPAETALARSIARREGGAPR